MVRIRVITRDGSEMLVEAAEQGQSLMQALRTGGIDEIAAICGGSCLCATCQVYVNAGDLIRLPPISEDERDTLEGSLEMQDNSRLSCQVPFTAALDGLTLTVAPLE